MSLIDQIFQQIGGNEVSNLSQNLGANEQATQSAIQKALPMIIGALSKQTGTREGAFNIANLLDSDGDGNIMDDVAGFFSQSDNGAGPNILDSLFGGKKGGVTNGLSQMTDLEPNQASNLMENLAPVVMGFLSNQKSNQGLNVSALAGLLGNEAQKVKQGGNGADAMGFLENFLDSDGDGSSMDDIAGMIGKFMK